MHSDDVSIDVQGNSNYQRVLFYKTKCLGEGTSPVRLYFHESPLITLTFLKWMILAIVAFQLWPLTFSRSYFFISMVLINSPGQKSLVQR